MGLRTETFIYDDFTGEDDPTVQRVTLSLDGREVELDLGENSRSVLAATLEPYFEAGSPVTRRRASKNGHRSRTGTGKAGKAAGNAAIREWAWKQGYDISEKGRIPQEVRDAYAAAH
jgi:hypothetical protein